MTLLTMTINSKKELFFYTVLIVLGMMCMGMLYLLHSNKGFILISGIITYCSLWRIYHLRNLKIEISQHVFSVKYWHPIWGNERYPSLELPIEKIKSYRIYRKGACSYFVIFLVSKKGLKKQIYNLGVVSAFQLNNLTKHCNILKNGTGL